MQKYLLVTICILLGFQSNAQKKDNKEYKIMSKFFKEERVIKVHLPKKFNRNEKLPVIFVFDAQWYPFYNLIISSIDYLTEINELPKSLVVGILSKKRQFEFTPEPVNEDWKMPSLGGAKKLENHLLQEVLPLIDSLHQIQPFRTAIGHSLGGTFILNSLIDSPNLFNAVIAISPNLQIDDEEIVLKIKRNITTLKRGNKFLFVTIGTKGEPDSSFLSSVKKLDSVMTLETSKTFHWNFKIYKGFNHATTPLESINNSLLLFSEKWKISDSKRKSMLNSKNLLLSFNQFYENLSSWAGHPVLPSKNDYYKFISYLETSKRYNDVIKFYKSAIKKFPSESRFYNGVAENTVKLGNKKEAIIYLQQALKVLENELFEYADNKEYFKQLYNKNLEKLK